MELTYVISLFDRHDFYLALDICLIYFLNIDIQEQDSNGSVTFYIIFVNHIEFGFAFWFFKSLICDIGLQIYHGNFELTANL